MSENIAEVIFYHSLEGDAVTPQSMLEQLDTQRERIVDGRLSSFYIKDLKPFQQYGDVGDEDIPQRYRNFTDRVSSGIKEAAERPEGFSGIFYPLSGVDLSTVLPLLKHKGVLITLDSQDPFYKGHRAGSEDATNVDRIITRNNAYEKATHGMHSVELQRDGWALAAELQLAGFDANRGDIFHVTDHKEGPQIEEGYLLPTRERTKAEITIGGRKILWIHYKMNLGINTLNEQEQNKEQIWQDLRRDLKVLFSGGEDCLIVSKAGMYDSVGTKAVAHSDLLQPGNFIVKDKTYDPNEELPGIIFSQRSLEQLQDIAPQFDEEYIKSHKLIHPYIQFGYQDHPSKIFLAKVENKTSAEE